MRRVPRRVDEPVTRMRMGLGLVSIFAMATAMATRDGLV